MLMARHEVWSGPLCQAAGLLVLQQMMALPSSAGCWYRMQLAPRAALPSQKSRLLPAQLPSGAVLDTPLGTMGLH
jgi:hypothetical protein